MHNKYFTSGELAKTLLESSPEKLLELLITRQNTGVNYHRALLKFMYWLDISVFVKDQQKHLKDEANAVLVSERFYTDFCKKIPAFWVEGGEINPMGLINTALNDEASAADKARILKQLYQMWYLWELETHKFLSDLYYRSQELNCYPVQKYLERLVQKQYQEILEIDREHQMLRDADFDINTIRTIFGGKDE